MGEPTRSKGSLRTLLRVDTVRRPEKLGRGVLLAVIAVLLLALFPDRVLAQSVVGTEQYSTATAVTSQQSQVVASVQEAEAYVASVEVPEVPMPEIPEPVSPDVPEAVVIPAIPEPAPSEPVEVPEEPVQEVPVEETPVEETPVEEVPVEEVPVEEVPAEPAPEQPVPGDNNPVPTQPAPLEPPVGEAPVGEVPAEEGPVEETPVEGLPVEEVPVEEVPVEPAPEVPGSEAAVPEEPVTEGPVTEEPAPAEGSVPTTPAPTAQDAAGLPIPAESEPVEVDYAAVVQEEPLLAEEPAPTPQPTETGTDAGRSEPRPAPSTGQEAAFTETATRHTSTSPAEHFSVVPEAGIALTLLGASEAPEASAPKIAALHRNDTESVMAREDAGAAEGTASRSAGVPNGKGGSSGMPEPAPVGPSSTTGSSFSAGSGTGAFWVPLFLLCALAPIAVAQARRGLLFPFGELPKLHSLPGSFPERPG